MLYNNPVVLLDIYIFKQKDNFMKQLIAIIATVAAATAFAQAPAAKKEEAKPAAAK